MRTFDVILTLVLIGSIIYAINKKKPKKIASIIFIIAITLLYLVKTFGVTPSAKLTYNITRTNQYEYVSNYNIENGQSIIISMFENDQSLKKYNLSLYNKKLGMYFKNFISYEKKLIGVVENEDFEIICIKVGTNYYYIVDFVASKINYLELNGSVIEKSNRSYIIFELEEDIYSIKTDDSNLNWYSVSLPNYLN